MTGQPTEVVIGTFLVVFLCRLQKFLVVFLIVVACESCFLFNLSPALDHWQQRHTQHLQAFKCWPHTIGKGCKLLKSIEIYIFLNLNIYLNLACFVCHCCCKTEGEVSATPCNAWTMQRMYISPTQLDCRGKYYLVRGVFFLEYTSKTLQECETALTSRYWTRFFVFLYFCLCLFVFVSLCLDIALIKCLKGLKF